MPIRWLIWSEGVFLYKTFHELPEKLTNEDLTMDFYGILSHAGKFYVLSWYIKPLVCTVILCNKSSVQ